MSAEDWTVTVRDADLRRLGELEYRRLDLKLKYNDVSTWQLELDRNGKLVNELRAEGAGIIVTRNGQTVLSGYWTDETQTRTVDQNTIVMSGEDDTGWLAQRPVHPQPASTAPPYSTQAQDVRTAQASTVIRQFVNFNAASLALTARRVPGLFAGGDPLLGPTLTGAGRWQSLLTLVQELAAASEAAGTELGFVVRQTGTILSFFVYPTVDKTAYVRFSLDHGNLASFTYRRTRPKLTYAFVGGQGEGTARTIYEKADSAALAKWGRIEGFVDASNATTAAELSQAADAAFQEQGEQRSLSIIPIDTATQRFGIEYGLGYRVSVVLDSLGPADEPGTTSDVIQDVIREVTISLDENGEQIVPVIGTSGARLNQNKIFAAVRKLTRRTTNNERR